MADLEQQREPQFDPLVGEVIGIADALGWPIERGEGVVFHFDGPNKRIVLGAAGHGRRERVTALWREAAAALESDAECGRLREQLDAAREALRVALDCKGPYKGAVSKDGGVPAICTRCANIARAALGVVGEPEEGDAAKKSVTQGGIGDTAGFFLPPGVVGEQE